MGFSPYEILYKSPPPLIKDIKGELKEIFKKSNFAPAGSRFRKNAQ
jgi:hypothetical protein